VSAERERVGSTRVRQGKTATRLPVLLRGTASHARAEFTTRFGPVERVLLAILIALPSAFMWNFASPSYFFWDDLAFLYWADISATSLSYAFEPSWGHLSPAYRLAYLALDRVAPMDFEVALALLLTFHAVSAVLVQRILTLLFGRRWWTYVLALIWAISVIYLPAFTWFAGGLHSIPAITATLASIHGYLCWRANGRRTWLVWSLMAMIIGLGFYIKVLLVPLYLVLMRVLLLDPGVRLRDSLRSVRDEWRVWLAYATVCVAYLLIYSLGDYLRPEGSATLGEVPRYLRLFWVEGFSPIVFGVRVPQEGRGDWHQMFMVIVQVALIGLVAWSVARRRTAWRAWVFLVLTVAANAMMVFGRAGMWGIEPVALTLRYYTEPALLVALAIPFAFASPVRPPRPGVHGEQLLLLDRLDAPAEIVKLPTARAGWAAVLALAAYFGVTWATAGSLPTSESEAQSGRYSRAYFDNLRADLAAARRDSSQPSLLDHDVPDSVVGQISNLDPSALEAGVRYSLLSSVVPLVDDQVTFNEPGQLHIVQPDGHLQRTRFSPVAGGSVEELRREGLLTLYETAVERRDGEWCVAAEGLSALQWEPRSPLRGRDWWLRVRYRTEPSQPFWMQSNAGLGWGDEGFKLPPMDSTGTAIVGLSELPEGAPTNAGVRIDIPPFGRLCLRSLEVGYFEPSVPSPSTNANLLE
jgi:hypothetical protein